MERGILVVTCPDRPGLISAVTSMLALHGTNVIEAEQHSEPTTDRFFMRVEFEPRGASFDAVASGMTALANQFEMEWKLRSSARPKRMAIFVSKYDHCLLDLVWRVRQGEIPAEIACIVSNHPDLQHVVEGFGLPFHHVAITKDNKAAQEEAELSLLRDYAVDFVVMARYMQILSPVFLDGFPMQVINVHHGLLPAFAGAKPYDQARDRGVKIIGATAHYATAVLDDGPIIDQEAVRVSHRDTVADMLQVGRDAERLVLARAVRAHSEERVFLDGRRTVVLG
ncbi:MAG: formyltetrahydrofolate deformylase [Dehalococcoidia bacterium]|nr:formyltetrahydrofolate deformylase [Dehalococcoidia bacterium]MCA9844487.1 formyltetrahydrofolate deformylase [Dehalococcoidia bacterium]